MPFVVIRKHKISKMTQGATYSDFELAYQDARSTSAGHNDPVFIVEENTRKVVSVITNDTDGVYGVGSIPVTIPLEDVDVE